MSSNGMMGLFGIDVLEIPVLGDILNLLISIPNILITSVSALFGMLLYGLQQGLFIMIDCISLVFKRIAGLDVYYVNGVATEGDVVYSLLQNPIVTSVFTSVLVASIFLLFVTTFIAIFKTEFDLSKSNAKGPIIGRAIKSVLYFACVPIICILGVYISNVFLRTFDSATSHNSHSMSAQVFSAAAYGANRARDDAEFANIVKNSGLIPGITASSTQAEVADAIDDAFRLGSKANGIDSNDNRKYKELVIDIQWRGHMQGWAIVTTGAHPVMGGKAIIYINHFSIRNPLIVYYYYDLFPGYNYLIGFLGSWTIALLLITLIIGVIQRIFELVILFVVSPAFVATMPLDEGARFGKWKDAFVKRTMSAYGPVIGINLLFMVLSLVQDINIFDPDMIIMGDLFNCIIHCLFIIVGLVAVKDFSNLISELVGSNDALTQGEQKKAEVLKKSGRTAALAATGARIGAKVGWGAGSILKNRRHDKPIKQEETKASNRLMNRLGLSKEKAKKAVALWKDGKLEDGQAKTILDALNTAGKLSKDKIKGKMPDISKELVKANNILTGDLRKALKDADDNNTNFLYALIGPELKETRYSKWNKRIADEKKVGDIQSDEEKKLAASMLIKAKQYKGELESLSFDQHIKIRRDLELESVRLRNAGKTVEADAIDKWIANFDVKVKDGENQKQNALNKLEEVGSMKNIKPEALNKIDREVIAVGANVAVSMEKLKQDVEAELKRARSIP